MFKLKYLKYKKKYLDLKNNFKGGNLDIFNEVKSNNIHNVIQILNNNPDLVDIKDNIGNTPLFFAVINKNKEMINLLISKNENVINYKNYAGFTVLFYAIFMKDYDLILYLLDNNSEINIKDFKEHTPLYFSSIFGTMEIMDLLVKRGADINALYSNQKTIIFKVLDHLKYKLLTENQENEINQPNQGNIFLIGGNLVNQNILNNLNIFPDFHFILNDLNIPMIDMNFNFDTLLNIIKFLINNNVNIDVKDLENRNLINYVTQIFIEDKKLNIDQVSEDDKFRLFFYKEILILLKPNVFKIQEEDINNISALSIIENKGYIGKELKEFFNYYLTK